MIIKTDYAPSKKKKKQTMKTGKEIMSDYVSWLLLLLWYLKPSAY